MSVRAPQGRQEDAEEYLGFILNGLHEEMLSLKKLLAAHSESELSGLQRLGPLPGGLSHVPRACLSGSAAPSSLHSVALVAFPLPVTQHLCNYT